MVSTDNTLNPLQNFTSEDFQNPLKVSNALAPFIAKHSNTWKFIEENTFGSKDELLKSKKQFIDVLLRIISEEGEWKKWKNDSALNQCFLVLRLLCRESLGSEKVYSEDSMKILLLHATMLPTQTFVDSQNQLEVLKCVANILLQSADCRAKVLSVLTESTTKIQSQLPASPPSMANSVMVVNEVLKLMFNLLTAEQNDGSVGLMGIVPKTESPKEWNEREGYKEILASTLQIYLNFENVVDKNPLATPISHCIHTLMNYPVKNYTTLFFGSDSNQPNLGVLEKSLSILKSTIDIAFNKTEAKLSASSSESTIHVGNGDDEDETALVGGQRIDDVLPPLIIFLKNLAKDDMRSRIYIRDVLMPKDIDRTKALDSGSALPNRMIKMMTSISLNTLKETVSELIFTLCDEDASKLIQYVGYGNCAGFLFQRGLLPQNTPTTSSSGMPATMGSMSTSDKRQINPITGEYVPDREEESEWDKMTEEEKEREAERLFVLFEKLNKTGVIKVGMPDKDSK
ncbi:hypothetical protein HK098_005130 [Nowakowskiella sp. JEL0407]|nr:hypothetical protein HK098_005130 [Nowakowskiella sp. JEL0407]